MLRDDRDKLLNGTQNNNNRKIRINNNKAIIIEETNNKIKKFIISKRSDQLEAVSSGKMVPFKFLIMTIH
jgi:hypothetical protein